LLPGTGRNCRIPLQNGKAGNGLEPMIMPLRRAVILCGLVCVLFNFRASKSISITCLFQGKEVGNRETEKAH
jgi:hypothetical protein